MQECSCSEGIAGFQSGRIPADDVLLHENNEVAEALRCYICTKIYNDPVALHCCGSIICKGCITSWQCTRAVCPTCASPLDHSSTTSVLRPLKQVVDLLEVHCPNASDGCSFTFPYGSLEQHLKTCEFAKVPCPYACFGCSTIATPRWRLWAHLLSNADRHNKFQANAAQVQCAGEITQPERWPEKDGHQRMPAGTASKTHYYLKQLQNPPHEDNWKLASADPRLVASAGRSSRRKEQI